MNRPAAIAAFWALALLVGPASAQVMPPQPYGTSQPYGGTSQPYGMSQPYGGTSQPYGGTSQPNGTSQPYGGTSQPYGGTSQPYGGTSQPYGTSQPQGGPQPYGASEPGQPIYGSPSSASPSFGATGAPWSGPQGSFWPSQSGALQPVVRDSVPLKPGVPPNFPRPQVPTTLPSRKSPSNEAPPQSGPLPQ
jgi:hypothetical protein